MNFLESIRNGHLREEIETQFGNWGKITFRFRWLIVVIMFTFLGLLFSQLKNLQFDTSMESFFHKSDPTLQRYNEFRRQYGREDSVMVAIKTDEVFDRDFLDKLYRLHKDFEQHVPYLNQVDSLVNARLTLGNDEGLVVKEFLEDWPLSPHEINRLKGLALNNPLYVGNYISADGKITMMQIQNQVYLPNENELDVLNGFEEADTPDTKRQFDENELLGGKENAEIKSAIDNIIKNYQSDDFHIYVASGPYTTSSFMDTTRKSMLKYTGYGIVLTALLLAFIFKRFVMIFLPLSVALLSMLSAMSIMSLMGIRLSFSMQIVPSFLLAVGVGNSVHVFTAFFHALDEGRSKADAIAHALQHSGLAIFMTGVTTAGGLVSFISSNMKPIAEFGSITPVGVLFALFFSLTLLPALIAITPIKIKKPVQENKPAMINRLLMACGDYATDNPLKVVSGWALIIGISLFFAFQIKFSFFVYNQLPPEHPLIQSLRVVDDEMSGAAPLEIIIDTGRVDGVKDPAFLHKVDQVYSMMNTFEYDNHTFNKVISIIDINKELHQALNENRPDFYTIPDDPALIAQELLLFENSGSDDLEKMVDSTFRHARLSFRTPSLDGIRFQPIMNAFMKEFDNIFGNEYQVQVTGLLDLTLNIFKELYYSMAKTYIIAFIIITPLMILLIGDLRTGLVSMIPNLAPIIITLGVMGAFNIHLTTATLLTGSIAMGLVVDDTIHFMHNFQRFFQRTGDVKKSVHLTLQTTGKAITFTTIVLSSAFMIFMLNEVIEWAYFGLVTGLCIMIALLADIMLSPALVALLHRNTLVRTANT
ncbi:MAG: MMPL family transporter [Pseudomonadales bacterium]|nr:MMPL family transporter [Pseudomonadales bacterium]